MCSIQYVVSCCFCQDEARVQKVTKRIHTLEEVDINVKLLTEMLSNYNRDSSTDSDREIIKVSAHTNTHTHTQLAQKYCHLFSP